MILQTARRGNGHGKRISCYDQRENQQPLKQLNFGKPRETARRGQSSGVYSARWLKSSVDFGFGDPDDTSDSEDSQCPGSPNLQSIDDSSPVVSDWEGENDEESCSSILSPVPFGIDSEVLEQAPRLNVPNTSITGELVKPKEEDATDEIEIVYVKNAPSTSHACNLASLDVKKKCQEEEIAIGEVISDSDETVVDEAAPLVDRRRETVIVNERRPTGETWSNLTLKQKMKVRVGLSHLPGWSEINLVRVDGILKRGRIYAQRLKKFPILQIVLFHKTMDYSKDQIYLFIRDLQCYVALYRADLMTCYVADGVNSFNSRPDNILSLIPQEGWRKKIKVKVIEYSMQEYVDEGAISAVMIMMEFQRFYSDRNDYDLIGWPESFTNHPKWYLQEMRLRWHKDNTVPRIEPNSVSLNHRRITHCYCGFDFEPETWNQITIHRRCCNHYQNELKRLKKSKRRRLEV